MFKFAVALIVTSVLVTVYAVEILRKSQVPDIEWANHYLDVPEPAEALPVVLILEENRTLSIPDNISQVMAKGKKIVSGTQFFMTKTDNRMQMFFCAEQPQNSQNTCLAPKVFQESEQLKCELEATPHVINEFDHMIIPCGDGGLLHRVFFPICEPDPNWEDQYKYKTGALQIYDFCYNRYRGKIVFTSHHIYSPKLLNTFLLHQDRTINYPYVYDERYPIANHEYLYRVSNMSLSLLSRFPDYLVQNFVPSEDMPFGIWKKVINQSYNVGLQHNVVLPHWNYINEKVREKVIRHDISNHDNLFLVKTGVLDNRVGIPAYGVFQQIYNFWVKMMISMERQSKELESGVALFMTNFKTKFGELSDVQEKSLYEDFVKYCEQPVGCTQGLKDRALQSSVMVKCCRVTSGLAQWFGVQINYTLPELQIRDLTTRPRH